MTLFDKQNLLPVKHNNLLYFLLNLCFISKIHLTLRIQVDENKSILKFYVQTINFLTLEKHKPEVILHVFDLVVEKTTSGRIMAKRKAQNTGDRSTGEGKRRRNRTRKSKKNISKGKVEKQTKPKVTKKAVKKVKEVSLS